MLSKQSLKLLKAFKPSKQYIEGKLPGKVNLTLLEHLINEGYVAHSRLPPEGDPLYPHGASIYWITSSGLEALQKHREDTQKRWLARLWAVAKYLIAWGIGVATPRIASLIARVPFIKHWLDNIG